MPSAPRSDSAKPAGAVRRLRWHVEAAAAATCLNALRLATPTTRLSVGRALGTVFWAVDARHRRNAQRNIALAFGDTLSPRDVRRLTRDSMCHYTRVLVESAAFSGFRPERVRAEGLEHLRNGLAKGHGLLGFSGHFGHWELLQLVLAHHGLPSFSVVRPIDNPLLDARVSELRSLAGNGVLPKRGAVASALRRLREGRFVTLLIDQRSKDTGVPVSFLGRSAFAADLLAALALRTGAPIVPGFAFLEPDGAWRVVVEPEVPVTVTGDPRADVQRVMTDCTAILERWVRRYPEQWLWTHAKLTA